MCMYEYILTNLQTRYSEPRDLIISISSFSSPKQFQIYPDLCWLRAADVRGVKLKLGSLEMGESATKAPLFVLVQFGGVKYI